MKRYLKQRGQTIVEFAFVFPIFCLIFFGIMYGGMICLDLLTLNNIASQEAHKAAYEIETSYKNTRPSILDSIFGRDARVTFTKSGNYPKSGILLLSKWYNFSNGISYNVEREEQGDLNLMTVTIEAECETKNNILNDILPKKIRVKQSAAYNKYPYGW